MLRILQRGGRAQPYDRRMLGLLRGTVADLLTWARSRVHTVAYLVQGDAWVFVSLALLLASVVQARDIGSPWLPPLLVVVGVVGTVVGVGRDVVLFLGKRADWEFARRGLAFPPGTPVADDALGRRMTTAMGSMFVSPQVNQLLRSSRTPVEMQTAAFRLGEGLRPYASTFLSRTGPTSPFNGRCVRLDSDVTPDTVASPVPEVVWILPPPSSFKRTVSFSRSAIRAL